MRTALLITVAAFAVLAGCDQSDEVALGETAANRGQVLPITDEAASAANAATASLPTQPVPPDRARGLMDERHENYEKIGDAMKVVSRELKTDSPDLAAVRQNAGTIATLAPQIPSWFPPGTGPQAGKTDAKAVIWERPQDFESKAKDFAAAALAFNAAAQGTDLSTIRAAHGTLGKTCKACHDVYREKD